VTLQKWIRQGRIESPKLEIRNGRAVRLWSASQVRQLRELKERSDYFRRFAEHVKAVAETMKRPRKLRQARLNFKK
jgi:hypothetical protein